MGNDTLANMITCIRNANLRKTKTVEILFVTYKPESTIIEESQQLKFAIRLKELGYKIKVLDQRKEVLNQTKNLL